MKIAEEVSIYRNRRERLARAIGEGVALVPTAPERPRNRDSHYPYRFDSYFYYLTGFTEPEATLVVVGGRSPRTLLFCRERSEEREIWDGFRHGPEAARERFGFDEAHPISRARRGPAAPAREPARAALSDRRRRRMGCAGHPLAEPVRARARAGVAAPERVQDVRAALDDMRLLKDAHEARAHAPRGRHRRRGAPPRDAVGAAGAQRVRDRSGAAVRIPPQRRAVPGLLADRRRRRPTPACCTTCPTTRRCATATCC